MFSNRNMSDQCDYVLSGAKHNFGIFRKSGKRAILQVDFLSSKIKIIQRGNVKYDHDFDQLVRYDSGEGLTISVKLGHKDLEFDAAHTEEKLAICRLLGIVKEGDLTSQHVESSKIQDVCRKESVTRKASSVIKEGFLEKKGHAAIQVWSKRRIKLSPGELTYYKPDEEIALNIVQLTPERYSIKPSGNSGFVLVVSDRKYHFRVISEMKTINIHQERADWIGAFNQACCQRRKTVLLLENELSHIVRNDLQPLPCLFELPRPCSDPEFNSGTGITLPTANKKPLTTKPEIVRLSNVIPKTEVLECMTKLRPKKTGKTMKNNTDDSSKDLSENIADDTDEVEIVDPKGDQSEEWSDSSGRVSNQTDSEDRDSQRSTSSSEKQMDQIIVHEQYGEDSMLYENKTSCTVGEQNSHNDKNECLQGTSTKEIVSTPTTEDELKSPIRMPELKTQLAEKAVESATEYCDVANICSAIPQHTINDNDKSEDIVNTDNTMSKEIPTPPPPAPAPPPPPPPPPPPLQMDSSDRKFRILHWSIINKAQLKTSIWKNAKDATPKINTQLLLENFSIGKNAPIRLIAETDDKKVILDDRRARNLAIILNGLKMDNACSIHDIINSVHENETFPAEKLTTIRRYQPTSDDIEVYKLYSDRRDTLDPVDKFMLDLCAIPYLGMRLDFVLLLWDFPRQLQCSYQAVDKILKSCDELLNSPSFVTILEYILAIGNYMINQNGTDKKAIGFRITSLGKFIEMRGKSSDHTFLHVLAEQLQNEEESIKSWTEGLGSVHSCEGLSIPAVTTEVEVLKCDLSTLKKSLKTLKSKLKKPTENEQVFLNKAQAQLIEMESTLHKVDKASSQVLAKYRRTLEYFGEPHTVPSNEFFGSLSQFISKYTIAEQDVQRRGKSFLDEQRC